MGVFNSKNYSDNSVEAEKTKKIDPNEKIILDTVNSIVEGGQYRDDELVYSKHNLAVRARVHDAEIINNVHSLQLDFYVTNPYLDEPIVEVISGIGKTKEEAYKNGGANFAESVLIPIIQGLEGSKETIIKSEIMGKTRIFRKSNQNSTMMAGYGNTNMTDLWQLVREDIPLYLGTKKVYWIKLFAACSGNHPICEVRINNIVYPQLTQKLFKYVKSWSDMDKYHSEKQFIVLVQDDKTYEECSFTKEQVMDYTLKSIALFQQVDSAETRNQAVNTIKMLCRDDVLALEICTFLPEIYTQVIFNLKESDGLVAIMGENKYSIRKSQLRVYGYIEDAVYRYIHYEKPSREQNLKVMCLSSKMSALNKLVQGGGKLEDAVFPAMAYYVNDNYVVR